MELLSRLKRVLFPDVTQYPEEHRLVRGFVDRLVESYYVSFLSLDELAYFTSVSKPLQGDEMWKWVCSPKRNRWLRERVEEGLACQGLSVKIDNEWRAKRRVK